MTQFTVSAQIKANHVVSFPLPWPTALKFEVFLARTRQTHPTADEDALLACIFARGLEAVEQESHMNAPNARAISPAEEFDSNEPVETGSPLMTSAAHILEMPAELDHDTQLLVLAFAGALAGKLHAAQLKYGYTNGWAAPDWLEACREQLVLHVAKGDPLDVAAYCAFLWHHGAETHPVNGWPHAVRTHYAKAQREAQRAEQAEAECRRLQQLLDVAHLSAEREADAICAKHRPGPRTIPKACAVLQDAVTGAGCCIHIDESASLEVMFGDADDSVHVIPEDLAELLEALSVIEQHRSGPSALPAED